MMPSVKEPLAGLALLVILGFLIWYNRPLENPRLLDPYLQDETARLTGQGAYEAWLWQDPFGFDPDYGLGGAAEEWALAARGEKRDENFSSAVPDGLTCKVSLSSVLDPAKKDEKRPIVMAPLVKVAPHTLENREMRTRQRYAVVAGLVESGYRPLEPGTLHFCSIQENREKDGRENDDPEMDHREYDMRWERYQYKPKGESGDDSTGGKPDIVVAWIDSGIVTDASKFPAKHPCTKSCDFAFKNLLKEISRNNRLYLFDVGDVLDSERSTQVLDHIRCLKNPSAGSAGAKGGNKGQVGCSRAGDIQFLKLAGMEVREKQDRCNAEAKAQPADQVVERNQGADKEHTPHVAGGAGQGTEGEDTKRVAGESPEEPAQCGSKTGEETGSEKLAGLLAKELTLRGVTHRSQVMTISEHGSENAATLGVNFRNCLSKLLAGQERATESPSQEVAQPECGKPTSAGSSGDASRRSDEIRNVFYLKGMDGKIPRTRDQYGKDKNHKDANDGDGRDRDKSGHAEKDKRIPSIELRHSPPLSVGATQLDYFYRLAEEMNRAHQIVDFEKRDSGIRAVVILGSDFHDKLLIIQALREKMPHLLILTTDLDTRMLHSKHWRATRNLVVASHFDLRLREKPNADMDEVIKEDKKETDNPHFWERAYQNQFPPFRDSQQTNIFYRVFSIADGGAKGIEKSAKTFPRIFEVGRNGFVRLDSVEKNNMLDYHPLDDTQENTIKELWLLFAIAVSLTGFYLAIRPWSRQIFSWLLGGTVLVFAFVSLSMDGMVFFSTNAAKEPLSFTNGVSLWPTLVIQIVTIFLAAIFFVQSLCELEGNFCRLSKRYFFSIPKFSVCPEPHEVDECEPWWERRMKSLRNPSKRGRRTVYVLTVTIFLYVLNDVYPSKFPLWWCLLVLTIIAVLYIWHCWKDVSIKHWMENNSWFPSDKKSTNGKEFESLWEQYYDHGRSGPRVARAVGIWLIFAVIETLLVYLMPPWPLPWRGADDPANWLDMIHLAPWIGVLSFTVTMLLLFFILDAVRLNFYWIRKLRTQHPLLTGKPQCHDCPISRYRLERMVLLVSERTQAVDKLIYYPMFCIMLMLLARITYFDNQEFPLSKGITFGAAISFLFLSGFVLRREASELRLCVRRRIRDMRPRYGNTLEINETISRIDAIDEGAFQPMLEQPVMQALLIMLASVGLFAGEYLKVFG